MRSSTTLDPEYQAALLQSFYQTLPGMEAAMCIQCGTCSGSCPLGREMDMGPRKILAMLMDGYLQDVLTSKTIWLCVSCNACLTRCPREIPVPDIMYHLRVLAAEHGFARRGYKMPDLFRAFIHQAEKRGRINESRLVMRYGFSHPGDMPGRLGLALKLIKRGRI